MSKDTDTPHLRGAIVGLAAQGAFEAPAFERAMELAGVRPDGAQWLRFLRIACLVAGAALLGAALIYFIAYNWNGLTRLDKIILIGASMAAASIGAVIARPRSLRGRASLTLAILCLGALLAFVGQTYQTGADPWQLFAVWVVLALPWAIAAAWPPIWALELVLANVAVYLYLGEAPHVPFIYVHEFVFAVVLAVVNALAAAAAEALRATSVFRLLPRLAAVLALGLATVAALESILQNAHLEGLLVFTVLAPMAWWAYRVRQVDVLILAAAALGLIAVIVTFVGKAMSAVPNSGSWFFLALLIIVLSAGAAHQLRRIAREDEDSEHQGEAP